MAQDIQLVNALDNNNDAFCVCLCIFCIENKVITYVNRLQLFKL